VTTRLPKALLRFSIFNRLIGAPRVRPCGQ
jgi:hypothetical protein